VLRWGHPTEIGNTGGDDGRLESPSRSGVRGGGALQEPWYRDPAGYRTFAGKYYVDIKPTLVKAGLAKA